MKCKWTIEISEIGGLIEMYDRWKNYVKIRKSKNENNNR